VQKENGSRRRIRRPGKEDTIGKREGKGSTSFKRTREETPSKRPKEKKLMRGQEGSSKGHKTMVSLLILIVIGRKKRDRENELNPGDEEKK